MGWPVAIAAAAGAVMGYGKVQEGRARAKSLKAEAASYALEAKVAATQAKQLSADAHEKLTSDIKAIVAMRAGKNLNADSPGAYALMKAYEKESILAMDRAILDPSLRSLSAKNARLARLQEASAAKRIGWIDAAGTALQTVARVYGAIGGGGAPAGGS